MENVAISSFQSRLFFLLSQIASSQSFHSIFQVEVLSEAYHDSLTFANQPPLSSPKAFLIALLKSTPSFPAFPEDHQSPRPAFPDHQSPCPAFPEDQVSSTLSLLLKII